MSPRALGALAAVLGSGILIAALVSEVFGRLAARSDPLGRLSHEGLLVTLSSRRIGGVLDQLRQLPVYRRLLDSGTGGSIGARLGWASGVPAIPWPALLEDRVAAVGVYDQGWLVVGPVHELRLEGHRSLDEGAWRLVASSESLLRLPPPPSRPRPPLAAAGEIRLEADLRRLLPLVGRELRSLMPVRLEGQVRASRGRVRETWTLACEPGCLLDALDPEGSAGAPSSGWDALPSDATAVAWVRLLSESLESFPAGRAHGSSDLGERLDRVEAFLGLPLRGALARSLSGTALVALLQEPLEGVPRLLAAFDLLHPEAVSRPLDRLAALGLLTGSVQIGSYRGARIMSWTAGAEGGIWEPAVAVDGGVLLMATRRSDLEDALDRRRDGERSASEPSLRSRLDAFPRASWKSWSRSRWVLARWEEILAGSPSPALPGEIAACEAWLRSDDGAWLLEGGGAGPALGAEFLFPSLGRGIRGQR